MREHILTQLFDRRTRVRAEGRAETEVARAHRDEGFEPRNEIIRRTNDADAEHFVRHECAGLVGVPFGHHGVLDGGKIGFRHAESVENERAEARTVVGNFVAQGSLGGFVIC